MLFAGLASACNLSPYEIGGGGGDDIIDAGGDRDAIDADPTRIDAGEFDAMPDACTPFPERCNEVDDDCDNNVDEGFDLTADPANCGACGERCFQPNAAGTCIASDCEYACLPGFVDTDMPANLEDGCEYLCTPSNGGVEVCDEADNNCNTLFDEGLGLESDVNNCGSCGNRCVALNATATCAASTCGFGACDPGFKDLVPAIAGCEYECPVAETTETCNGVDDDCDGVVDDNVTGLGQACTDPGFAPTGDTGACTFGTTDCSFGVVVCENYERPGTEVCDDTRVGDERDEDCDGMIDDGFNKMTDPRHCGSCSPCIVTNAIAGCAGGMCTVAQCLPGFVNANNSPTDGCEYACTPSGPEQCDGVDNDCDRLFDLDDPDLVANKPPSTFCKSAGTCSGATITCQADGCGGPVTWQCNYGTDSEQGAFTPSGGCGLLPLEEARCDNLDGDCDNQTDESYEPAKGSACTDTELGACQGTGDMRCNAAGNALECIITDENEDPLAPPAEACNDIDDDCNGVIDEGAPDEMVQVVNGATTYYVYKYEASRPDAQADAFGQASHRSCSKPGVLPWRSVTQVEAAAACAATGKRLCTEAEWQYSCEGPTPTLFDYPYSNTYQPLTCNGRDFDVDCANPDSDAVQRTGYPYGDTNTSLAGCQSPATTACVSREEAVDLSGNLREWTSTPIGGTAFRVKGGGFDTIEQGLTCDFSFLAFAPDVELPNLGFRCCSNTP